VVCPPRSSKSGEKTHPRHPGKRYDALPSSPLGLVLSVKGQGRQQRRTAENRRHASAHRGMGRDPRVHRKHPQGTSQDRQEEQVLDDLQSKDPLGQHFKFPNVSATALPAPVKLWWDQVSIPRLAKARNFDIFLQYQALHTPPYNSQDHPKKTIYSMPTI